MCTYWNKVKLRGLKKNRKKSLDSIGIGLASPEEIRRWGERRLPNGKVVGKVDKDHTVDYESLKPIEGGLFCERIFGPVEDFSCSCERRGEKGEQFCPECEVEFTKSQVRRTRMGYIPLAVPVAHVWYLRGRPSYIANLIGKSRSTVDKLAYGETLCESFIGDTVHQRCNEIDDSTASKGFASTLHQRDAMKREDAPNESTRGATKTGTLDDLQLKDIDTNLKGRGTHLTPLPSKREPILSLNNRIIEANHENGHRPRNSEESNRIQKEKKDEKKYENHWYKVVNKSKYDQLHTLPVSSTFTYKEWSDRFAFLDYVIWPAQKNDLPLPFYSRQNDCHVARRSSINLVRNQFTLERNLKDSILGLLNEKGIDGDAAPMTDAWKSKDESRSNSLDKTPVQRVSWFHHIDSKGEGKGGILHRKDTSKNNRKERIKEEPLEVDEQRIISDERGDSFTVKECDGVYRSEMHGVDEKRSEDACTLSMASPPLKGKKWGKVDDTQQFPRLSELLQFTGGAALRGLLSRFHLVLLGRFLRHELKALELKINGLLALKMLTYSQGLLLGKLAKRRSKQIRRLKLIELFQSQKSNPEWMILSILPVLPPDLRPILRVNDDFVVASDLNRLYQTVLRRNNTIHDRLGDPLPCPESGLFRQRSLQKAVDGLLENGKGGGTPLCAAKRRPLVSLSHVLKGKKGLFRQHLLGKRVDYSGRSVIVVGPKLNLHECGLPKEMAMELFQPFLIHRLKVKGLATSNTVARRMIQQEDPAIWQTVKELIYEHPVLLNRAPTLHRLGIQAFQPRLVSGRAILLHPLVCNGFNADFDGDQMAVHVPLSFQARAEAWKIMWSKNNLLSPATGQPILVPSQDMVLGCYYLSVILPRVKNKSLSHTFKESTDLPKTGVDSQLAQNQLAQKKNVLASSMHRTLYEQSESRDASTMERTSAKTLLPGYSVRNQIFIKSLDKKKVVHLPPSIATIPLSSAQVDQSSNAAIRDEPFDEQSSFFTSGKKSSGHSFINEIDEMLSGVDQESPGVSHQANPEKGESFSHRNFISNKIITPNYNLKRGHYFSNLQDSLVAYSLGKLQTHTPFWVRLTTQTETDLTKVNRKVFGTKGVTVGKNQSTPPVDNNGGLGRIVVEANDTLEPPLELRLSADGSLVKLCATLQNHLNSKATISDQCDEKSVRYMRTTAGRVVINNALFHSGLH